MYAYYYYYYVVCTFDIHPVISLTPQGPDSATAYISIMLQMLSTEASSVYNASFKW